MSGGPIRAVVIDDEPLARERVRRFLEEVPQIELAGEADSGGGAVRLIRREDPDLVFLDIQLQDRDGFDVIRRIGTGRMPPVVFVTAYDEYALRAFDVGAVDYLLKPFDEERFRQAATQAIERVDLESTAQRARRLEAVMEALEEVGVEAGDAGYAERLLVHSRGAIRFVNTGGVRWVEAAGNYVRLHTVAGDTHLVRETMSRLEQKLDPDRFVRIHRSAMVNLEHVEELRHWSSGEYRVELDDGTELKLTRTYRDRILDRVLGR